MTECMSKVWLTGAPHGETFPCVTNIDLDTCGDWMRDREHFDEWQIIHGKNNKQQNVSTMLTF